MFIICLQVSLCLPQVILRSPNSSIGGCGTSAVDWNTAACGTDNGGNIDTDPMFVGGGENPLMISASSPCKNAGDNSVVTALTDILGNAKLLTQLLTWVLMKCRDALIRFILLTNHLKVTLVIQI